MNGFLNVFLVTSLGQFADRIQVMLRPKKAVKHSFNAEKNQEFEQAAYVIKPIGHLESVYREKFGTP